MKIKLALIAAIALCSVANGATSVTVSNFSFANGLQGSVVTDAFGSPIRNFNLAVGTLNTTGDFIANGTPSMVSIMSNAVTFNTTIADAVVTTNPASTTDPFLGKNIYVMIGDPSTPILFDTGVAFVAEDAILGGSSSVNIEPRQATLVTGFSTTADTTGVNAPFNALTNGVSATQIPEPSVALLGALGILGLVRRRR